MSLVPNHEPITTLSAASQTRMGIARRSAVAVPHLAAFALMLHTEADFGAWLGFTLAWGILNCFWLALLRRPAVSGALALTMVVVLVLLSRLKHDVVQMTANFVDLMVIDHDSAAFLFTIFPNLKLSVAAAAAGVLPLMGLLWWGDPFRGARLPALPRKLACLAVLTFYSLNWREDAWRGYYDDGYLSKFARSASLRCRTSSRTASWNRMRSPTAVCPRHCRTPAIRPGGNRISC